MVECPRCGTDNSKPVSRWVGGAKTSKPMDVQRFVCASCKTSYAAWKDTKTGMLKTMTRKK